MALTEDKVFQIRLSNERKAAYSKAAALSAVKLAVWIKAVLDAEISDTPSKSVTKVTNPDKQHWCGLKGYKP